MNDQIQVAVRARPMIQREQNDSKCSINWSVDGESIWLNNQPTTRYSYDQVFDQAVNNASVYENAVAPIVDAAMNGYNGTIFAYGQTSSGKTYTIMGEENDRGMIPLAIEHIFNAVDETPDREFLLRVSYLEIYRDDMLDLLTGGKELKIREKQSGEVYVENLFEEVVKDPKHIMQLLEQGQKRRHVGETNMNERSSRSHTIFRIVIESREISSPDESAVFVSQLNLVDLAGSERANQSGATGDRLKEGVAINKSLSALSFVIHQLTQGNTRYVNYRDSPLTRTLQSSLGGNAKTVIICNVTPVAIDETKSTLEFASQAKRVQNKPIQNEVVTDEALIKKYQKDIRKLNEQLGQLKAQSGIAALQSENDALNKEIEKYKAEQQRIKEMFLIGHVPKEETASAFAPVKNRRRTWCPGQRSAAQVTANALFSRRPAIKFSTESEPAQPLIPLEHDISMSPNRSFPSRPIDDVLSELSAEDKLKESEFSSPGSAAVPRKRLCVNRLDTVMEEERTNQTQPDPTDQSAERIRQLEERLLESESVIKSQQSEIATLNDRWVAEHDSTPSPPVVSRPKLLLDPNLEQTAFEDTRLDFSHLEIAENRKEQELNSEIETLKKEVAELRGRLVNGMSQEVTDEVKAEIIRIAKDNQKLKAECKALTDKCKQMESAAAKETTDISTCTDESADSESQRHQELVKMCEKLLADNESRAEEIKDLQQQLEIERHRSQDHYSRLEVAESCLNCRDRSYVELKSFHVHELESLEEIRQQKDELEEKCHRLEADLDLAKDNCHKLETDVELATIEKANDSSQYNAASVMVVELREGLETAEKALIKEKEKFQTVNKELEDTRKRAENAAKDVSDYEWMLEETKKKHTNTMTQLRQRVNELENAATPISIDAQAETEPELQLMEKRLAELDSKCNEMIDQIETRDQTIDQLETTVQQMKDAADAHQSETDAALVSKVSDLESRLNEGQKLRESLDGELQSTQNKHSDTVAQLNAQIEQLLIKPHCASTETETELDVAALESRVCVLIGQNDALTTAQSTMLETIQTLENTIEQLRITPICVDVGAETEADVLPELESRVADLNDQNQQLIGQLETRDHTIATLQDSVQQLDQEFAGQEQKLIGQLESRDQTIATLQNTVQQLDQELTDQNQQLIGQLETRDQTIANLQASLQQLGQEKSELSDVEIRLNELMAEKESTAKTHAEQLQQMQATIEKMQRDYEESIVSCENAAKELALVKSELHNVSNSHQSLVAELQSQIQTLEAQSAESSIVAESRREQLETIKKEKEALIERIGAVDQSHSDKINQLQTRIGEIEAQKSEVECSLQNQIDGLRREMDDKDAHATQLVQQLTEAQRFSSQLQESQTNAEQQLKNSTDSIASLSCELAECQDQLQVYKDSVRLLEENCDDADDIEEEKNKLETKCAQLTSEIAALKSSNANLTESGDAEQLTQLQLRVDSLTKENERKRIELVQEGMKLAQIERALINAKETHKKEIAALRNDLAYKEAKIREHKNELRLEREKKEECTVRISRTSSDAGRKALPSKDGSGSSSSLRSNPPAAASGFMDTYNLQQERHKNYQLNKQINELQGKLQQFEAQTAATQEEADKENAPNAAYGGDQTPAKPSVPETPKEKKPLSQRFSLKKKEKDSGGPKTPKTPKAPVARQTDTPDKCKQQ